jgi:DNA-nicking Smr family endonuclease
MSGEKGRSKHPSDEDRSFFRDAVKGATPLKRPRASVPMSPIKPPFRPPPHLPPQPVFADRPAPTIGGHAQAHLRRGRIEPDARLDLHGMTEAAAYRATLRFLARAQADRLRFVLVITGKGGVLRARLPLWLGQPELRPLIAGVAEAHIRHGGSGAFYAHLRQGETRR